MIERIATGGSSAVYRATDELLDRDVAIKQLIIDDHPEPDSVVQRARSEGMLHKLAAHEQPKYLVQLIDIIDDQRGLMLVTEYVDGPSLEQELADDPDPMPERRALAIVVGIAKALSAIHGKQIVHRDLKPGNVLITPKGRTKVSDFGLAAIMGDDQPTHEGTARYRPPELWRGESAGAKADLYALGFMAYEMLAGRKNFDQAFKSIVRDERTRDQRWMKWHTNARTRAPGLRTLNPDVSETVETLVNELMEKEPDARPASASEVIRRIKSYVTGGDEPEAITTSTPGDTAPLPAAPKRSPLVLLGVVLLTVLLLAQTGAGAFLIIDKQRTEQARINARIGQAVALADQGKTAIDEQRWSDALDHYTELEVGYADVPGATDRAAAGRAWAKAELDFAAGDSASAFTQILAAIDSGKWIDDDAALLDEREIVIRNKLNYHQHLAKITELIDKNQLEEAKAEIEDWQDFTSLTNAERQELEDLLIRLHGRQADVGLAKQYTLAKERINLDRTDEAIDILNKALAEADRRGISGFTVSQMRADVERLTGDRTYNDALRNARAAEKSGDMAAAIDAYKVVRNLRDTPEISDRIARLESDLLFTQGKTALDAGNTREAERLLTASLGKNPDNGAARKLLATIESAGRKAAFISAGDDAVAAGDYELAIKQYKNALALGPDPIINTKIDKSRVRLYHQQGLAAMRAGELDKARALLDRAQRLDPSDAAVSSAITDLNTEARYTQLLNDGLKALDRSEFRDALRDLREAQDVRDTNEVKRAINDAEYAQLMAQARAQIDAENFIAAQGSLRTALRVKDTPEVRKLLMELLGEVPEDE